MSAPAIDNAARARRTLDAIEVVDSIGDGEWSADDAIVMVGAVELVDGLRSYANYLEAVLVKMGGDPADIRASARRAALALAER